MFLCSNRQYQQLMELLRQIEGKQQITMAAIDDIKTAVAALNTSVTKEITAVTTAIAAAKQPDGSISAADAEAIVTQLGAVKATLDTETAALTPAPPTPAV